MADMKKLLHAFDEADEVLNDKINKNNLSTIVASATASVENKKTVLVRGTGRNIESLKVGGRIVQDGVPTTENPVEVKGVGDKVVNLVDMMVALSEGNNTVKNSDSSFTTTETTALFNTPYKFSDKDITIKLSGSVKYTQGSNHRIDILDSNKRQVAELRFDDASSVVATGSYIRFNWSTAGRVTFNEVMITTDIDNDTFVPYGSPKYKIPVSCNGEITNMYLDNPVFEGEVADLVNGVKDVKFRKVKIRDLDWKYYVNTSDANVKYFYADAENLNTATLIYYSECYVCGGKKVDSLIGSAPNGLYDNGVGVFKLKDTHYDNVQSMLNAVGDSYIVYYLSIPTTESFITSPIPTTSGSNELTIETEITPTTIDITTFGDYYSKAEINKLIADLKADIAAIAELL